MNGPARNDALEQALAVSRDLLQAAQSGDAETAVRLAAVRLELLQAADAAPAAGAPVADALIGEISRLNDQAIGAMEHRLRAKVREFDMAAVGRRAVEAYAVTRGSS